MLLHQLPRKELSLQELPRRNCHFTNSLGGMSHHQLSRKGLSLQELPRRDRHSKNSGEETVTPPTPEAVTPLTPEKQLLLQELPRKDCRSTNSRVKSNIRKVG
jgi:hypothetical protein